LSAGVTAWGGDPGFNRRIDMADNKFTRVEKEDDPNRCNGTTAHGQCWFVAVPGCKFCLMHGGGKQADENKKEGLRNYQLTRLAERVGAFSNNPNIKDLRDEIGILRMTLEKILEQCDTDNKLLVYSDKITNLVEKVNKIVESCQRMEERNNNLLDRKVVIVIADSIVTLIGQYVVDPDVLAELGTKICESISTAASGKE
jgi:hypothetical protein